MVYIASLNDQVVPCAFFSFLSLPIFALIRQPPVYSGLFITASHPLILRALYIDGDAYQCVLSFLPGGLLLMPHIGLRSSDFLSNLLVLLLRVLNSGIPDSGLLTHLSEATAGSLNGVGHSTAYEELATYAYDLATSLSFWITG
jgi:hypothetical protein